MPAAPQPSQKYAVSIPRATRNAHVSNLASAIKLLRKAELCAALGISGWTIDRWVRLRQFPAPIYVTDDAPSRWRVRDIEAWLTKKRSQRRRKPKPRGKLISRLSPEERAQRRAQPAKTRVVVRNATKRAS